MRRLRLPLLLFCALALPGCVASMAASAVGAAVRAAQGPERVVTYDRRQLATDACRARAAQHGTVRIIDAEQADNGRVTVWGTVQGAQERRSFECVYSDRVAAFRLREIRTP